MPRAALATAALGLFLAATLFLPAGTLRWPAAWAFLAFYVAYAIAGVRLVDPGLVEERTRRHADARPKDLLLATASMALLLPATLATAGFDHRLGWSPHVPGAIRAAAFALFATGYAIALHAARTNRFFSTVVRIQRERGHRVVDTGAYATVRHPGYAGSLLGHLALPLALGSLWAFVPTAAGVAFLVARTAYEDRALTEELPGYADYASRVRSKLVPGIW